MPHGWFEDIGEQFYRILRLVLWLFYQQWILPRPREDLITWRHVLSINPQVGSAGHTIRI